MIKKELYAAPATEVLELHLEGNVLEATSPGFGDRGLGGEGWVEGEE